MFVPIGKLLGAKHAGHSMGTVVQSGAQKDAIGVLTEP